MLLGWVIEQKPTVCSSPMTCRKRRVFLATGVVVLLMARILGYFRSFGSHLPPAQVSGTSTRQRETKLQGLLSRSGWGWQLVGFAAAFSALI